MSDIQKRKFSARRIKMIHLTSLIFSGMSFVWSVLTFLLELHLLGFYFLITTSFFYTISYLSKYGYPRLARILFVLLFNCSIAFASSYLGKETSVEFFLIFAIGLPFVFFSFRRERKMLYLFCSVPFIFWLLLYFSNFKLFIDTEVNISENSKNVMYHISITITLLFVVFQLIYFSYINARVNSTAHYKKQKAIDASDAKSHFLSTMSHEIRTPLNAVIGLSYILGDNNPRKDQVQNIEALNYSGKILLNLLNNVLDFSKMQSTDITLDHIPVDLLSAIKQIKKVHEASCLQKGIIMNLDIDDDIPFVWLDIVRFNQVINNLVTNAIKFTEEGSVTLRIKKINQNDENIELLTEIIDTGIGIPEDKQETIWEVFTQASSTTNRLYGGTGLGLPIVKSIVKAMGAEVKIDSKTDKGSRFYFQLKLKMASEKELQKKTHKTEHDFKGKKVLLVEDNDINVLVGKQILEKANLQVEVADDGISAVHMVKHQQFDVILMDIQMPKMDGYKASKEIRKFNKYIPIFALSASVFMQKKNKMIESEMNGFIFKPFDPQDLLNQIDVALKNNK